MKKTKIDWHNIGKDELDILSEYMDIYCQLVGNDRNADLPTFDHFKKTYDDPAYSLSIPHYRDAWMMGDYNTPRLIREKGLGTDKCENCGRGDYNKHKFIKIEYFNYWKGVKFKTREKK